MYRALNYIKQEDKKVRLILRLMDSYEVMK